VAGTQAIRSAAHYIAVNSLDLKPNWTEVPFQFGLKEMGILFLVIITFTSVVQKQKWFRYVYLAAVICIIGFWTNACLSIGSLAGLTMGYVPAFKSNLIWWMLLGPTVGAVIILGKNVWCNKLCPFFAVQYFLNKAGGSRLRLPDWVIIHGRKGIGFLLWLSLMVIFLSRNPALGAYEPFSMMFSLTGVGIQWFLLPASIIGAFFMPLFWCRCFCPLGHCLNQLILARKKTFKRLTSAKEIPHEQ